MAAGEGAKADKPRSRVASLALSWLPPLAAALAGAAAFLGTLDQGYIFDVRPAPTTRAR